MNLFCMAVRDRAANVFGTPYFALQIGAAVRGFTSEINRAAQDNNLYNYPADFDLYVIGTYDDATGVLTPETARQVCVGKDVAVRDK